MDWRVCVCVCVCVCVLGKVAKTKILKGIRLSPSGMKTSVSPNAGSAAANPSCPQLSVHLRKYLNPKELLCSHLYLFSQTACIQSLVVACKGPAALPQFWRAPQGQNSP